MTEIIAHRGFPLAARENTLPSFRAARAAGCDLVELDIRRTADGEVVVLHDATLSRLWGLSARACEVSLATVRALGCGDVRIPTLVEVLNDFAGTDVGVLVDSVDAADTALAVEVVRNHPAVVDGSVAVQWCGTHEAMLAVRTGDPDAVIRMATDDGIDEGITARLRPAYANREWVEADDDWLAAVRDAGLKAAVWTPNGPEDLRRCLALGVDAVTTDRPDLAHQLLAPAPVVDDPQLARALEVAVAIAERVIGLVRTTRPASVSTKASPADLVTEVDRAVEQLVRDTIAAELPGHVVVGEEMGGEPQPGRPTWWVDPVDGTTNLAAGIPWTSLSLALAIDDEPVVAVVAHPWTGDVWAAAQGRPTTRNGVVVAASPADSLAGGVVFTELAAEKVWPGMPEFLDRLAAEHVTARVMGSGTLALALPASGIGVGAFIHHYSPIDHLAAVLLATSAGCVVATPDGPTTAPHPGEPVLVAAPGVAAHLMSVVHFHD